MQVPYPLVFVLNWAAEAAVLLVVLRRGRFRVLAAATLANALTHPALWFGVPLVDADVSTKLVAAEAAVVAVETLVLAWMLRPLAYPAPRVLLAALAANVASLALTFAAPL